MATNINIKKFEVEDFVSVDHGKESVSLTIFQGKIQVGTPGWANSLEFSPDQAETLGKELINRANMVRKNNQGGNS